LKQVLQQIDSGATEVRDVPAPLCGPGEVLVATRASLLSAGTERSLVQFTRRSLLGKARERPDQVRRVLEKMRREGVMETLRQVRARMQDPLALGYSSAGVVLEVGREVRRFRPGDRVAGNGPHAEVVAVPQNLVAPVPDGVPFDAACYAVVGAISLQGVRLAQVSLGEKVAVIGLGLLGQIAVRLLRATGCEVLASDPDVSRRALAASAGARVATPEEFDDLVATRTGGVGADAVVITASSEGNGPLEAAARVARRRARIVAVGAIGMDVPRRIFYPKELELVVSCSYGPGRYDPEYEERGRDYPIAHVRWTEQRNIEAVLGAMESGALDTASLTTHSHSIEDAEKAYALLEDGAEPSMGIVLRYPGLIVDSLAAARRVELPAAAAAPRGDFGVAVVGAGNFAGAVLLPALEKVPGVRLRALASAGGIHAAIRGERHGFEVACSGLDAVLEDPAVHAVLLATRHDLHAEQALACLRAGRAVMVEKPLAITRASLQAFEEGLASLGPNAPIWTVGYNRRFATATGVVREHFRGVTGPRVVTVRFNAGPLPAEHWTQDAGIGGGRLIGEACHAVDLCIHLVGAPPVRVFAEGLADAGNGDAEALITMRFADGSAASIAYVAGGDKSFPKERVEMFGGGRIGVLDDFASVTLVAEGKSKSPRLGGRDKGHDAGVAAFLAAVRSGGSSPIPAAELLAGARATLAVVESLDTGLPVDLDPDRTP
jgi:predicted dehydrogenase